MPRIAWTSEYEISIPVIDGQHRRIVDYINDLHDAVEQADSHTTARVINDLVDYTYSHFAFEEALMEEAGYDALAIHQGTHRAFCQRLDKLKNDFHQGQEVATQLADMLQTWLISHILSDDNSYAPLVRSAMPRVETHRQGSWLNAALKRFFD